MKRVNERHMEKRHVHTVAQIDEEVSNVQSKIVLEAVAKRFP